jgi:hypothetical protein
VTLFLAGRLGSVYTPTISCKRALARFDLLPAPYRQFPYRLPVGISGGDHLCAPVSDDREVWIVFFCDGRA